MTDHSIVDFDRLEREQELHRSAWHAGKPFEILVIDDFADPRALERILAEFPDPGGLNKSRDYVFAREKYEKNHFADISETMGRLHAELVSPRFAGWLSHVTGKSIFVDPTFHGGGLHSGGPGSYLDMHADFNVHPIHDDWIRELNILLYLNPGWQAEWGGSLKLRHLDTRATEAIEPLFNRCVVMLTKGHTLHGYDPISFPEGRFRRSIAAYGYSLAADGVVVAPRSTAWRSETSAVRRAIGPLTLRLVSIKNRLFGSGSARNR